MNIHPYHATPPCLLPLFGSRIAAGFPSPADDFIDTKLDLNQLLIKNPAATFFVQVEGDAMIGAGFMAGDYLIVDRSLTPVHGAFVLAVLESELVLRRFQKTMHGYELHAANPSYAPIRIKGSDTLQIWGVTTNIIRKFTVG